MLSGITFGLVLGFFPFNSDANFRHSLELGNPDRIYLAATKWPTDNSRLVYASNIFETNKMPDKAITLINMAINFNPRNFDAWTFIYKSSASTQEQKKIALLKLKELDPHNSSIK